MDKMFVKYKEEFVASMRSTLDMLYNSKNILDLEISHGSKVDAIKLQEISKNILKLETALNNYQHGYITPEEQNIALAAMGTAVVHLEYLSRCYSEAAQKAKIIIANVKNGTENI